MQKNRKKQKIKMMGLTQKMKRKSSNSISKSEKNSLKLPIIRKKIWGFCPGLSKILLNEEKM